MDVTGIKLFSSIAIQFLNDYSQILWIISDSDQHIADHRQSAYHCLAALIGSVDSYAQWGSKKVNFWTFIPNTEGLWLLTLSHAGILLKIGFEICLPCLQIKLKVIYMLHKNSYSGFKPVVLKESSHRHFINFVDSYCLWDYLSFWLILFRIIFFYFYFTKVRGFIDLKTVGSQIRFSVNIIAKL